MSATISIDLPEYTYHQLESVAAREKRSIVELVSALAVEKATMPKLPDALEDEIAAFAMLSDDMLLLIARSNFSDAQSKEMTALLSKAKDSDNLISIDSERLQELVELSDTMMVRKAAALNILGERGHDVKKVLAESITA